MQNFGTLRQPLLGFRITVATRRRRREEEEFPLAPMGVLAPGSPHLEETQAFMEARETGKRDLVLLSGGPSSSQVNAVKVQVTVVKRPEKRTTPHA
jgi:hypothetical protein